MKFISRSPSDTEKLAERFLKGLTLAKDGATIIGLYGDLGSGKTTFVQAVGQLLGITDSIQSPTFVIIKTYNLQLTTNNKGFQNLIHVDSYRLEKGEELRKLGFKELLSHPKNLILIEWADRVAGVLPPDHIKLLCKFMDEQTREFTVENSKS